MKVLDLFSGIGGFSLGLERAGFETVAFCEIESYARAVLAKHWPKVPIFEDVKELTGEGLRVAGVRPDVICGGFPCQDISLAGKGAGLVGERSGLWREFHRLIAETTPRYAIIENVSALRSRGLDVVLRQLAEIGYDAEWHCIPAAAVGAPHRRDRVWIVAYPGGGQLRQQSGRCGGQDWASSAQSAVNGEERAVADAYQPRLEIQLSRDAGQQSAAVGGDRWWAVEPDVGRVAYGVPSRVDRLRCLGNAVVSQIPEIIGRVIQAYELKRVVAA